MSRPRLKRLATGLALSLLILVGIEGACSGLYFAWEVWTRFELPIQERHHTRYDPELGWVNEPDLRDPDLYAPGRGFTSNGQGFRNPADFPVEVPAGRLRVICAGDSFTLGYGVGDDDSWPAQLEALDPRLEAVNMGQGGYGVDQAWLWYRRDALSLDQDLLLFAFIGDDFERMRRATFRGYGKPLLRVVDGRVAVGNVPVPRSSFRLPLWTQNAQLVGELRTVQLAQRALRKLTGRGPGSRRFDLDEAQTQALSLAIFEELQRATQARAARLALVLLPNLDSRHPERLQGIPEHVRAALDQASAAGLVVFDLSEEFQLLDPQRRQELFIAPGELPLPGAKGHYNARGNRFVAEALHERLVAAGLLPAR